MIEIKFQWIRRLSWKNKSGPKEKLVLIRVRGEQRGEDVELVEKESQTFCTWGLTPNHTQWNAVSLGACVIGCILILMLILFRNCTSLWVYVAIEEWDLPINLQLMENRACCPITETEKPLPSEAILSQWLWHHIQSPVCSKVVAKHTL